MNHSFSARIKKIGVNPYVIPPVVVLKKIFQQSGKSVSPIHVKGTLNGFAFTQTLVRHDGKWRLYLNTPVRKATGLDVGNTGTFELFFNAEIDSVPLHPRLKKSFQKNKTAHAVFKKLIPSRQKEIKRYINHLKTMESVERNVAKVIRHLENGERFAGR